MSMGDRWLRSWLAAAPRDGCACTDSPELPSSLCSACSVPAHGSPSSSAAARYPGRRSDAYCFEIEVTGVERITERGGRLRRSLKAEHAFIPGFAARRSATLRRLSGPLGSCSDRTAVDGLVTCCPCVYESAASADTQIIYRLGIGPGAGYRAPWVWIGPLLRVDRTLGGAHWLARF
jgi:hypothetical protein